MPISSIFPTKGVGNSDEDYHGSVCAVSGVLTPPGEEERKKNHLILLSGTQSYPFATKMASPRKKKQEKRNLVPSL